LEQQGLAGPEWPQGLDVHVAGAWPPPPFPSGDKPLICILIEPVEADRRALLESLSWPYAILQAGDAGLREQVLAVVQHAWARKQSLGSDEAQRPPRWRWVCADCDDADCERHGFLGRLNGLDRRDADAA
jgi:hypothetical protein